MEQAILTTKRDQITREDKEGLIRRILLGFQCHAIQNRSK